MDYFGADFDLSRLTTTEPLVQYALDARRDKPAADGVKARKGRSGTTVAHEIALLRAAMRAVGLPQPAAPKLKAKPKPQEPLTEEEQKRVLMAATPRHKLTALLLLTLGPRRKEVASLCTDVDWNAQTMRIAGTKTDESDRVVPIPDELFDHMLQLRAAGKWEGFPRVSPSLIGKMVRQLCKRAGIPRRSPNDFRGTASQRMRQGGVDAEVRAAIQGNSARMQEATYTQTSKLVDVMREAVNSTKRLTPPRAAKKGETGT